MILSCVQQQMLKENQHFLVYQSGFLWEGINKSVTRKSCMIYKLQLATIHKSIVKQDTLTGKIISYSSAQYETNRRHMCSYIQILSSHDSVHCFDQIQKHFFITLQVVFVVCPLLTLSLPSPLPLPLPPSPFPLPSLSLPTPNSHGIGYGFPLPPPCLQGEYH